MEDQEKIQNFVTTRLLDVGIAVLNLIVFSSLLLYYDYLSFFIFAILGTTSVLWIKLFLKRRKRIDYNRFFAKSENKNNIYEMIQGMAEVKIHTAEKVRIERWKRSQKELNDLTISSIYLTHYQSTGRHFINQFRNLLINGVCAFLVINQSLTLGTMMTISYLLGQLSGPLKTISNVTSSFHDTLYSMERLDYINQKKDEDDDSKLGFTQSIKRGFELKGLSFKYFNNSKRWVLDELNLKIPKGQITAIVGASGSGKSTLVKLLLSFYYPQRGNIFLDGTPLCRINAREWRSKCGVVMQDGRIFSGTIAENIAISMENPDMDQVKKAARIACIDDFIVTLPMGYSTKIGKSGIEMSGGQKQRILIARAVYKNPEFIVLDEATSSLDSSNEKQIHEQLQDFFKGRTVVIVAHRLSTVKNADNIVVMDKGKIIEEGTHDLLASRKGAYYELVRNQLELGN